MGKRIAKALFALAVVADCAMTAALVVKAFCPTAEEKLDAQVERAMAEMTRSKYSEEPVAVERPLDDEEESEKDLINEGFENIMTFAVNGKTGFDG